MDSEIKHPVNSIYWVQDLLCILHHWTFTILLLYFQVGQLRHGDIERLV